jgi:predicted transcriptional regulator
VSPRMTRRPDGALERAALAVLWAADRPLLAGEVNERLDDELAYTSVATVLSRLLAKGLVERTPVGRAFAYQPAVEESELAARRIDAVLSESADRTKVLTQFVGRLSKRDAKLLRALLGDRSA